MRALMPAEETVMKTETALTTVAFIAMYQRCLAGTDFDYYGCDV